jgi:hypothetical protein
MNLSPVVQLGMDCLEVAEVLTWVGDLCKVQVLTSHGLAWNKITPSQQPQSWIVLKTTNFAELCHWTVLSIEKCVSEHQLLTFEVLIFISDFVPLRRLGPESSLLQPGLVIA